MNTRIQTQTNLPSLSGLATLLRSGVQKARALVDELRTAQMLSRLSDRQLRDLGLTRGDIDGTMANARELRSARQQRLRCPW